MAKKIFKRILQIIPILIAVTFIVYLIMSLTPGEPARLILGENASQEAIDAFNEEYGINRPFLVRYFTYVKDIIVNRSFGKSWRTGRDVMREVLARFPVTLYVAVFSVTVASLIGVPLGVISAVKQYSPIDNILRFISMLVASFPPFWLGMILVLIFALGLHLFPPNGSDSARYFVLPVLTIALPNAASFLRFTRSTMLETIRQDYIRTARAKGLPEKKVLVGHALRNALLPIITLIGTSFGRLLGGVVIIENVFALQGLGQFALTAINSKDIPQAMASVIFLSTMSCLIILVVDIIYSLVDPRIKAE